MNNRALPLGIAVIAVGVLIVLGKLGVISALLRWLWPTALIAAGVLLWFAAARRTLPSIAYVPAALLAGGALPLLFCAWFGWGWMKALWPLIPLAVAVGLYVYAAAERIPPLRTTALVLGAISAVLWIAALLIHANGYVVALLLIIAGVALIARRPNFR